MGDSETVLAVDDPVEGMLRAQAVRKALADLRPDHRRVLIELYFRARSAEETAELLGIPAGTVRSRTHYALRSLRAALH
jgi:RNA polymerase sigma-70 factor (ECF subfamily)